MTKKKAGTLTRKAVSVTAPTPEEGARKIAKSVASPELAATRIITAVESPDIKAQLNVPRLLTVLCEQTEIINRGDLRVAEAMLFDQAIALQSLFSRLVERGMNAELTVHYEAHMRFALRAQAQCTRTLEVLAAIKNPPVVIARQANIAQQQQVNNGVHPPARATEMMQNKVLEELPDERLEPGTPTTPSHADPHLATLGALHRPKVGSR